MRCRLCGHVFDASALACHAGCPLGARCSLICCPNCGYQVVDESKSGLAKALARWFGRNEDDAASSRRPDDVGVPLTHVATGEEVVVHRLGEMPSGRASRLTAYGLTPGTAVAVLQRRPVPVVRVGETEIAISEEILAQILVRVPAADQPS
ncbi:MAG: FeoA domain-containing protein [Planctomycetaceae bacterium]